MDFCNRLRKLSPAAPELCCRASGIMLQKLWKLTTELLEKVYGSSCEKPGLSSRRQALL